MSSAGKAAAPEAGLYGRPDDRTTRTKIEMPAPSSWPMVIAFGIAFILAGFVTSWALSGIGVVIALRAAVGWWREVIPYEECEEIAIDPDRRPSRIEPETRTVMRLQVGEAHHRAALPLRFHPYTAGVKGGIVGGFVMAALACLYGLIAQHSIWYPINLLAGVVMPEMGRASVEQLRAFNGVAFLAALAGHAVISILMGIIYAAILPMFPKHAPIWAGILMPLFWSGIIATTLDVINPALNARISWPWFIVSQLGFGLFGGYVIARSANIDTLQSLSFASRAFVHAPGLRPPGQQRAGEHQEENPDNRQ